MERIIRVCEETDVLEAALIINASLFLSNRIRKDTTVFIKVRGVGVIRIDGSKARRLYPDSESLVGALKALRKGRAPKGVSLTDECPELTSYTVFCPGMRIEDLSKSVVIDPSACIFTYPYTHDAKIIILNIELDRALYLNFRSQNGVLGTTRYEGEK